MHVAYAGLQGSLLDLDDAITVGALGRSVERHPLSDGAWLDVRRGWIGGAAVLFEALLDVVEWCSDERPMYDRTVAVPRLLSFYDQDQPLPHPVLVKARKALDRHYGLELGEPFRTAGLCLYRDGRDSVAWHGDRIGRGSHENTMVAIISLGAARPLLLRPRGGGPSRRYEVGHGDLIVMGGSCQRTWEHAVPKIAQTRGPRISVQFRPHGVS